MSHRTRAVEFRRGLWRLSSAVGVITPDDSRYGNHGTMVNAPTFADTPWGVSSMEFDGDDAHVNLGDLTYLNAVSVFTIAFWMNQDVLDAADTFFVKITDASNYIQLVIHAASGTMRMHINTGGGGNYGHFDYSTVISASSWSHVAIVFDGSQTGNANRLVIYVDGMPITLAFAGTIPTITANMAGQDFLIGNTAGTFDGRLYDFQILDIPATRDEVNDLMRGHG